MNWFQTCYYQTHENVPQEGVVDDVPEPMEVSEDIMGHVWAGLQQQPHSGPELGCEPKQTNKQGMCYWNQELRLEPVYLPLLSVHLWVTTKVICAGVMR